MQVNTFDSMARQMAIGSIDAYQTYISPKKGFSCAHRTLHQDESCSDYIKRMFATESFASAVQMSRQRFHNCAKASQTLRLSANPGCVVVPCCFPI